MWARRNLGQACVFPSVKQLPLPLQKHFGSTGVGPAIEGSFSTRLAQQAVAIDPVPYSSMDKCAEGAAGQTTTGRAKTGNSEVVEFTE